MKKKDQYFSIYKSQYNMPNQVIKRLRNITKNYNIKDKKN